MTRRLLQVITTTDRRGAETRAVELGPALQERGWAVDTVALAPGAHGGGLPVTALGGRRLAAATLRALRSRAHGTAAVIAHGSTTLPASALALAGTRVPFVYRNIGEPGDWATTPLRRLRSRVLLGRARAVVALTDAIAVTLTRDFAVRPERVCVIPHGVPAASFPPVTAASHARARERFGLAPDVPVLVYLGALSPEKDVATAVDAMSRLPGVHLLVAGDGPDRTALEARSATVAPGRVRFVGSVQDPSEALAAADAIVLPSRTEGLPGVLIEAGLMGLPAIATDVGSVSDIVVDGVTGRLVPPADPDGFARAIRDVLDDPVALGDAARAPCRDRYELKVVAEAWDGLLGRILDRH